MITRRRVRTALQVLAVLLLLVAAKGVVDSFHIGGAREGVRRAEAAARLIGAVGALLLVVGFGLAAVRAWWSAGSVGGTGLVFIYVVSLDRQTLLTYAMVPLAAVMLLTAVAVDDGLDRRRGPG